MAQRAGGDPAGGAGGERGVAGEGAGPERRGGGEAVGEGAALVDGGAVAAEQVGLVGEVGREPGAVLGEQGAVGGEVGVQDGVEVQGPAVVVVEGAGAAVGVPAVAEVEAFDPLQAAPHGGVGRALLDAGLGEEAADREREEPPVVVVGGAVEGVGQPAADTVADGGVEAVPEPGPGESEGEGDRGGLDHGLAPVGDQRPGLRVVVGESAFGGGGAGAGVEAARVGVQQAVRVVAAGAGDPQGGGQEGAGVALQAVGAAPGPAGAGPGEVDQGVAGAGEGADGGEQFVGHGFPVRPGPAGAGAEVSVLGGQWHQLESFVGRRERVGPWPESRNRPIIRQGLRIK